MRVWAVNGTNAAPCGASSCSRRPYCLASTTIERPSGVSSASEESCAASASSASLTPGIGKKAAAWRLPSVIVPVLSSSSTSTSPDASTARPDSASTLRRTSRSMPAMPIADSSAPIVVGISATSSAIRTVIETGLPAYSANGRSVTTTTRKTMVRPTSRIPSAISFGVLRREAPSTRAIMRSMKDWPGSCVISTTMRSESTRVPPVTALRSPPASRMTGADSPVIADSSTDAMPSTTVPSPGITWPASTTTTSPRRSSEAGLLEPSRSVRDRLGAHRAQRVGLRLAAALRDRLGEVAEHDRQPEEERDREGEPPWVLAAGEPDQRRHRGADLDHEHDRVADDLARVELGQRRQDRGQHDVALQQRALGADRVDSVEGEVELEHVDRALAGQSEQRVAGVRRRPAPARGRGEPAAPGDAVGLDARVGLGDVGVDARGRGGHGVGGDGAGAQASASWAARASGSALTLAFSASARSFWFGPWLLKKVALALYFVAEGRLWKERRSREKSWPISFGRRPCRRA